uniref:Rhodanese domain-containing protein n=1 Tax=Leptobrachium leishanense TaxID=445787 RepID=A0A8C5LWJ3_9ANUR
MHQTHSRISLKSSTWIFRTSAPSTGSSKLAPHLKWHAARGLSTTVGKIIEYGELKELLKNEGVTHIDVREPWEVKEFGVINGTINIPIGDLIAALQMTPKDFEEKYHQELPDKSDTVVFYCLAGIRSQKALDVVSSLGYSRILNYGGGIEDWARHEAPIKS